jgi:hypothetical protein
MKTQYANSSSQRLFAEVEGCVSRLRECGEVTVGDVVSAHRMTAFRIAAQLWNICDNAARQALVANKHPHVRKTALASMRAEVGTKTDSQ